MARASVRTGEAVTKIAHGEGRVEVTCGAAAARRGVTTSRTL